MQFLINFSLLEFANDLHVFFADRIIFKVIELCRIVTEVQQIDPSFVLLVELLDIALNIEIRSMSFDDYYAYLTILSVSYFLDCSKAHLSISCCLMSLVF